jgi:hypothetical protein
MEGDALPPAAVEPAFKSSCRSIKNPAAGQWHLTTQIKKSLELISKNCILKKLF